LQITPIIHEVHTPDDIPGAFDKAVGAGVQAVQTTIESIFGLEHARVMDLGARLRVPVVSHSATWVQAGGLISYAPHIADLQGRTATYVDRILKGAKPSDLPVQQPTRFELVINLKTARTLGIDVPLALLDRADRVIE
jgi:putative tryptophan/tyrosine transport system substrate-binding protein